MKALNVLIPVDFSPASQKAWKMVDLVKLHQPVTLHLLHVIAANGNMEDIEDRGEQIKAQVASAKKRLQDLKAEINFHYEIKVGPLTDTITKYASEIDAELIIMGTKGSEGYMEFFSGSEAQHVARYSKVPVITVHQESMPVKLENILLLSDFGIGGFHPALGLLKAFSNGRTRIHLLHILKQDELGKMDELEHHMYQFAEDNKLENFNVHLFQEDKVEEGVYQFNEANDMDMVCIGTHARKGLGHLLFGSIAERLINHCSKPVFTYHLEN
jgi:nucleotide-binding universal stress UspA family protein